MKLLEFFEASAGGLSAARLNLLVWSIGVFGIWAFVSIKGLSLKEIPESVLIMIGVVTTGKVIQRFGENGQKPA